jgi:AcrR family transcriptional regulator
MGITGASLYNAFGDKRSLYHRVLEHYIESSLGERLRRYAPLAPRVALETFFREIVERSMADPQRRLLGPGCRSGKQHLHTQSQRSTRDCQRRAALLASRNHPCGQRHPR